MKDTIVIQQPAGIGDIFYTLKIAKKILDEQRAKRVIWPVHDAFAYIGDYIEYPGLQFVSSTNFNWNVERLNLQDADKIHRDCSLMTAKYKLVGLSDDDWLDYFNFERNYDREQLLFDKLNLTKDSEYIVVSEMYGSPPNSKKHTIPVETNKRVINIRYLPSVNVFDWCGVLENAEKIYMVDTSFMYIMEKLDLKSKRNDLYSRYKPSNFDVVKHIPQNVKWNFIDWN